MLQTMVHAGVRIESSKMAFGQFPTGVEGEGIVGMRGCQQHQAGQ
jgi:hypothetical protein